MSTPTPINSQLIIDPNPGTKRPGVGILGTALNNNVAKNSINQLRNVSSGPTNLGIPQHVSNVNVQTAGNGSQTTFKVAWQQPVGDSNYTGAHLLVSGYQGSTSPQRILSNGKSPAVFSLNSTREPVQVVVQATGNKGSADLATAPVSTAVCGRPLFGGYGSNVTPLSSADQIGGSVGGGQCPVTAPTVVSNALTTGGALTQWHASASVTIPGTVEFDVLAVGGLLDVLLLSGTTSGNPNGYIFRFDGRAFFPPGQVLVVTNGTWASIGTVGPANSGSLSGWHHVKAQVATGQVFNIWVDGVLQSTVTDNTHTLVQNIPTYYGYEVTTGPTIAQTGKTQTTIDHYPDGTNYAKPIISRINLGRPVIDFSEAIHSNKTLDFVGDGSTYARVVSTALSSGSVLASHISNRAVGQKTAGSVLCSGIPGTNLVFTGWKTLSTNTINIPSGTASVTFSVTQGSQVGGAGSLFTGIGFAIYSGADPGSPQVSNLGGAGTYSLTLSSPTTGTNLNLSLYLKMNGSNTWNTTSSSSLFQTVVQILDAGSIT